MLNKIHVCIVPSTGYQNVSGKNIVIFPKLLFKSRQSSYKWEVPNIVSQARIFLT